MTMVVQEASLGLMNHAKEIFKFSVRAKSLVLLLCGISLGGEGLQRLPGRLLNA